jgi:hypothetical protein
MVLRVLSVGRSRKSIADYCERAQSTWLCWRSNRASNNKRSFAMSHEYPALNFPSIQARLACIDRSSKMNFKANIRKHHV